MENAVPILSAFHIHCIAMLLPFVTFGLLLLCLPVGISLPAAQGKGTVQELTLHEIQILELLSTRREELARKEEELKAKENAIMALEQSINLKLSELDALNKVSQRVKLELKEIEDAKLKGLVKIYENMHPRRAAQIFDEMEMDSLVGLISAMKEMKVAPIIANMDVKKARELSICLTKRVLQNNAKQI